MAAIAMPSHCIAARYPAPNMISRYLSACLSRWPRSDTRCWRMPVSCSASATESNRAPGDFFVGRMYVQAIGRPVAEFFLELIGGPAGLIAAFLRYGG